MSGRFSHISWLRRSSSGEVHEAALVAELLVGLVHLEVRRMVDVGVVARQIAHPPALVLVVG